MKQVFTKLFTKVVIATVLGIVCSGTALGQTTTTYEQLTSIASIDEAAQYVLGIDGTGFHYEGTSSWGKTALPSAQTPLYYSLKKASNGESFTAETIISGTTYYLQIPTSNTFSMATSTGTNTDIIIGTTQISGTNYAVANKTTTTRHLRLNGTSGLRSYAGTTGTMAYFYKVVQSVTYTVSYNANGGTGTMTDSSSPYLSGATVTVKENSFTYAGHTFSKWNTEADGSGTDYDEGDTFSINANTTLYAQWTENSTSGTPDTATLTQSSLGLTGSYTSNTEKTIDGITYVYTDLMKSKETIQAKASTGTIKNTTAFPGDITSVAITHSGTARATTINGSSNGTDWVQVATGDGSITADFSGKGYKYFQITRGSNAAYWESIVVSYSGSSLNASDLVITNTPADLSFDLYNNASAQVIHYTTSCTGAITITPTSPTTYFSYVHDSSAKTITVTPIAVTPSAQTVTISQASDDSYGAGSTSFTVSISDTTPLSNIAALTAQTENGSYLVSLSDAVVTYVNGNYAYIQDASGAVVLYKSGHGFTAGDILNGTATIDYQLRNSNPQITDISGITKTSGTAPSPTTVAASAWNYTFNSVLSQYFQITGATLTSSNNKYYVTLGTDNVQLYKAGESISGLDVNRTYSLTGFPTLYNTTKELQIFVNPEVEVSSSPTITVVPDALPNFEYVAGNGPSAPQSFTVSGENLTSDISLSLGESDFEMSLSENSGYTNSLTLAQNSGVVSETSVYVRLKAGKTKGAYSGSISLTSTGATERVVSLSGNVAGAEYATLPFEFDGGVTDIEGVDGLTQDGLGSDYGSSPKLKFDTTDDYLLLKFNEAPGTLSFNIKGNGFSGGTFKVQTSVNGTDFADLATYNNLGNSLFEEETFSNLSSNVRYIKWIYENKSSGNVALGNISLEKVLPSITVDPITVEVAATPEAPETCFEGTLTITYANLPINSSEDFEIQMCDSEGSALTTEPEWVLVETAVENGSYLVSYVVEENTGAARTAYFKVRALDAEANIVSSDLVTISQAAYVAPATGEQFRLFTGTLVEGDYIIYYDGKAMNNTVTNDRLQYAEVTPENDVITTSDASIVWHIAPSGDYWTIYSAAANAYAASTGGKNKAQMLAEGTDDKALWTVSGTETYEFVNKQNTASSVNSNLRSNGNYGFACYATSTGGALSLYKNVNDPVLTPTIDLTLTLNNDRYWGTFYNGGARYTLPEGAFAYTMNAAHQLYLLGEGTVIPANTAVIIIADNESITLSKSSETTTVSISGEGNILLGSNAPVAVSTVSGTPYVLGVVNGALGFYKYIGTAIPAAKAYYIVNE